MGQKAFYLNYYGKNKNIKTIKKAITSIHFLTNENPPYQTNRH